MCDNVGGEDFRKALQTANSCIEEVEGLLKTELPPTPSTSRSPGSQFSPAADLDSKLIESMRKLIDILRRHVRVQYEVKFEEILHA